MIEIKTKLQKWGNSFGIVVPIGLAKKEEMRNGEEVSVFLKKKQKSNVLRETFGTLKFKKSVEQMMKETDQELYNE